VQTGHAQEARFQAGVHAGGSGYHASSALRGYDRSLGFSGGFWIRLPLASGAGFQTGLVYLDRSTIAIKREMLITPIQGGFATQNVDTERDIALNYLQVPILLSITASSSPRATWRLLIGPYAGFATRSEVGPVRADTALPSEPLPIDFSDRVYGISAGAMVIADIGLPFTVTLSPELSVDLTSATRRPNSDRFYAATLRAGIAL
jgi:hypothetical protein